MRWFGILICALITTHFSVSAGTLRYKVVAQEEYIYQSVMTEFYIIEAWEDELFGDSVLLRNDGDYLMFYGDLVHGVPVFESEPSVVEKVANITPDDTWTSYYVDDYPLYEVAVGEVQKTVPAGTFTAMEIDMWDGNNHSIYVGKKWLAEGVGYLGLEGEFLGVAAYERLTSYTYIGGSGYWPLAIGNELIFETGESMDVFNAPYVSIVVDGDPSDWTSFGPAIEDSENDDPSDYDGVDIKELYIAYDDVNLYMMFTFWDGGPTIEWGESRTGAYQVYVMPDDDESEEIGYISYYGPEPGFWFLSALNFGFNGTLTECGEVMECSIPLVNLGNPPSLFRYSLSVGDMDEDYDKSNMIGVNLAASSYVCGNANGDDLINIGDVVFLINYIFREGQAPDPVCVGDANVDGLTNVGDAAYLLNYIFREGPPPAEECCQ